MSGFHTDASKVLAMDKKDIINSKSENTSKATDSFESSKSIPGGNLENVPNKIISKKIDIESKSKRSKSMSPEDSSSLGGSDTSSSSKGKRASSRLKKMQFQNQLKLEESPLFLEAERNKKDLHGIVQNGGFKHFVEPDLAEPKPSYTGLPLESFPTAKIKKDSLWPSRGAGRRGRYSSKDKELLEQSEISELESEIETTYKNSLKTKISDEITNNSELRDPIKPKSRYTKSSKPSEKSLTKTPIQLKSNADEEVISPLRSSKRIKVTSPKKPSSTNLAPSSFTESRSNYDNEDEPTSDNEDFCTTCGGPGIFICCESCPKSFHFTCCDPPIEDVPEDNWHCRECTYKMNINARPQWNYVGLFGQLLNQQENRNPRVFQLPYNLRENTFIDVNTGEHGEYNDSTLKPELTFAKANGSQIVGYNWNQDLEIENLYKKNGKPYLCHYCGFAGKNNKTLVHCDYCPLVWHLDCLKEPMCGPKTIGSKWRCPNHVESLLPNGYYNRQLKSSSVLDVSLYNQFLKIAYMNSILIKHNDQPFFKENTYPTLEKYLQYQSENFKEFDEKFKNEDGKEIALNSNTPDYFQSIYRNGQVASKLSNELTKVLTLTNNDGSNPRSFIYRVPEKSILLDFITKSNSQRSGIKTEIMESVQEYENLGRLETDEEEREVVEALIKVKSEGSNSLNFDELVKVAMHIHENEVEEEFSKTEVSKLKLNDEEILELSKIKRLMEIKGKDELLRFLQS